MDFQDKKMPKGTKWDKLFKPETNQSYEPSIYWGNYQEGTIPYKDPRNVPPTESFSHDADAKLARYAGMEAVKRGMDIEDVWARLTHETTFGKYSPENPLRVRWKSHGDEKAIHNRTPIPAENAVGYALNYLYNKGPEQYAGKEGYFYNDPNLPVTPGRRQKLIDSLKPGFKTKEWQGIKKELTGKYNTWVESMKERSRVEALGDLLPEQAAAAWGR